MYPVNQVILGGDPILGSIDDIDVQIQKMEAYRKKLQQLKSQTVETSSVIWDKIDAEILPMTEDQRSKLFQDEEYFKVYTKLQNLVQTELLNLVKSKRESSAEGKALLDRQLSLLQGLKVKIIADTNKEMDLFKRFKEFSKNNPGVTYEDFIKASV